MGRRRRSGNSTQIQWFGALFLLLSLLHDHLIHSTPTNTTPQVYIVYLGRKYIKNNKNNNNKFIISKRHLHLLSNVFSSEEEAKQSMIYSYKHSFSGFSAMLNSSQVAALAKRKEVISLFKSKSVELHTTRSWDFMGLGLTTNEATTPLQLAYGENVIVGVIDSGIWPESKSFQEEPRMSPIPSTWKGKCVKGDMFNPEKACNNKLIGARYYLQGFESIYGSLNKSGNPEYRSARDFLGHGTHTASTTVGSIVEEASLLGLGLGTARGGAPRARLAVYKACWGKDYVGQCTEADVLAAFDDALHDGVHVISASIGASPPLPELFDSSNSIGSFHAMQLGVSVVFAAGNDGPDPGLVTNVEPWSICVAASSVDRMFSTDVIVQGNFSVTGESFITESITAKLVDPITYFTNGVCNLGYRKNTRSGAGRVILCFSTVGPVELGEAQEAALGINASALIFVQPFTTLSGPDVFPTVYLDIHQGTKIKHYLALFMRLPTLEIVTAKTIIGKSLAPKVAFFSSRGPSSISPDILKPDISAPGMNILAAWPRKTPPTVVPSSTYKVPVNWNIMSGTSMSCPHISAIVALLKSANPYWSPAVIKSALMTTAYTSTIGYNIVNKESMKVSDPFDIGAGHVDPMKAMDPGLVYDMKTIDYILFLCNLGYNQQQINALVHPSHDDDDDTTTLSCSQVRKSKANINYPSIAVSNLHSSITITRTVRNVGPSKFAVYFSSVVEPRGVEVVVWPRVLVFSWFREEITYYVTLLPRKKSRGIYDFGEIVWSDGVRRVRSPLVVCVNTITSLDHDDNDQLSDFITS
ncbi:subtilisin-like protease SBT3.18 [Humulus lupulus]|uniref:subtilisin-like protease SBT3.18 n=1 Tax=Humulus lupulus TaxID=3486 RepID=UPI002B4168F5|nr:subtilisin-like protease SBT3.18 [Humulus lupulus]